MLFGCVSDFLLFYGEVKVLKCVEGEVLVSGELLSEEEDFEVVTSRDEFGFEVSESLREMYEV